MPNSEQMSRVRLLDVREAALIAGRNPETVRRWVWAGKLPSVRRGRRVLVDRAELERVAGLPRQAGLAAWSQRAKAARVKLGGRPHASAADLVLADRAERSEPAGSSR